MDWESLYQSSGGSKGALFLISTVNLHLSNSKYHLLGGRFLLILPCFYQRIINRGDVSEDVYGVFFSQSNYSF